MAIVIIGLHERAQSEEWRYLPGDAFFRSTLTNESVSSIEMSKGGVATIEYRCERESREVLGYKFMEVKGHTKELGTRLRQVYDSIRNTEHPEYRISVVDGSEVRKELNGIPLYVYSRGFEWKEYIFGLRYNEKWVDECVAFGRPRDMTTYPMGATPLRRLIVEDWKNSTRVPALKAMLPTAVYNVPPRALQTTPVSVEVGDVMFIVVTDKAEEALR